MTQTIELTPRDTLASTLARYRAAGRERVLFVVPPEVVFSDVELAALRREAAAGGRGIAFVTTAIPLRAAAARAGISTFQTVANGEREAWRHAGPSFW